MAEKDSENRYSNWGASSAFSARSNGMNKPTNVSKPGAGNFFSFTESHTELGNGELPRKKAFSLFGNSSDSKKQNPWSQGLDGLPFADTESSLNSGDETQEKLSVGNSNLTSGLFGDHRSDAKLDVQRKQKLFGDVPPSINLTIDRNNTGMEGLSNGGSNISSLESTALQPNKNVPPQPKSRLGKLFSYFKKDNKIKDRVQQIYKTPHVTPKTLSNPSYKAIDTRRIGSMRRLVLKTKPIKYHLIDVNKILSSKGGIVVAANLSASKILSLGSSNDVELDEVEEEVEYKPFTSNASAEDAKEEGVTVDDPTDEQQQESETVTQHNGYWTYPSIDEISKMDFFSLENVHNFIIGRVGYGQIAYDYPVDLTNIVSNAEKNGKLIAEELFDNIVTLKQSAVLVYKGGDDKPPLGTELNVPATITLEGVRPKPTVSMENHINFLKRQIGMEFVTYDPITYIWVFKVKHFSVWGLIDEDDESQKDLASLKRKQDLNEVQALAEYSKVYSDDSFDQEVKKQKLNEYSKVVPGGWGSSVPPNDSLLKLKRSVVTDEIAEVLNRYRNFEDDTMAGKVSGITIDSDTDEVDEIEEVKLNPYEPVITDVTVFDNIRNRSTFPTTDNWLLQLELANQYNSSMAPMAPEDKFSKEKLTISKVDEILFADYEKRSKTRSDHEGSKRSIVSIKDVSTNDIRFLFSKLITDCQFKESSNSMPQLEAEGLNFTKFVNKADKSVHNLQIELASILFDQDNDSDTGRLVRFGEWLQKYNQTQIANLLEENEADNLYCVFLYLCVNMKINAIERALKSKNEHLSVILSLADLKDDLVTGLATTQIERWHDAGSIEYIPKPLVKIYQLLAKQMDQAAKNLSWSIVMGMNVYYGNTESIADLIAEFKSVLPEGDPVADLLQLFSQGVNFTAVVNSNLSKPLKWLFCLVSADFNFDEISTDLGNSLEKADSWKEALIVFSSIKDGNLKTELIRNLIIKKTQQVHFDVHDEKYLTTVLKVPRSLIYEAKALERMNAGDYWGEVNALIEVDFWSKAHDTIVAQLGPKSVITNSPAEIAKLMSVIEKFPQHGSIIPSWKKGAGIYQNYFNLTKRTDDTEVVIFLMEFLPLSKPETPKQKLAINIVAKFVGDLALEDARVSDNERQKILKMPLDKVNKAYFELRLSRTS
ncbi:NUP145 [Candida margitis]|uniref:NUP145 n=1 Tax=Candida margitis TaxID=1775924 RepID=UPI0022271341|nr:NUP145 [Candida margitis]KAI5964981.1 NUP145 [Candida margitis]